MTSERLTIELSWWDETAVELTATARNALFSGRCALYATAEELAAFRAALAGLEGTSGSRRLAQLGTFEGRGPGGGLRLNLAPELPATSEPLDPDTIRVDVELVSPGRAGARRPDRLKLELVVPWAALRPFEAGLSELIEAVTAAPSEHRAKPTAKLA